MLILFRCSAPARVIQGEPLSVHHHAPHSPKHCSHCTPDAVGTRLQADVKTL